MTRFVNPAAVERLPLGTCSCPGTPHPEDWVDLRTEFSGSEWYQMIQGDTDRSLTIIITGWSFVDEDGPVPVNVATVALLDVATFTAIDKWVGEHVRFPDLPNASAAPSPSSTRASGSRTRRTRATA